MDHPHEPINAIKEWQEWYRTHAVVASMDEPLMSKDSRENLHDTSKATYEMPDWRSFYKELAEVDIGPTEVDDNGEAAEFFNGLPHQIDAFNWLQDQVSL